MSSQTTGSPAVFEVECIGGIDHTTVELSPGVTVLAGRNATNRTSFLQSIMAAMGSCNVSIKGDVSEATVRMELYDSMYERTLQQKGSTLASSGEAFLDDPEIANLFAFLLGDNETRQAVTRKSDLRDIIMRPIDTEEIERDIQRLMEKKSDIESELEQVDELKREFPVLEQQKKELNSEIDEKRSELQRIEERIDESQFDLEETREEKAGMEELLADLRETRSDLEEIRYDIETKKESIKSLKKDRPELQTKLEEINDIQPETLEDLEAEVERLRSKKRRLETNTNDIRTVLQFNQKVFDDNDGTVDALMGKKKRAQDVTDQLFDDDDRVACWTCGSVVEREKIKETIDQLQSLHEENRSQIDRITSEIDDLKNEMRHLERQQQNQAELERKLSKTESEIERREEQLEDLTAERDSLSDTVEDLEAEMDTFDSTDFDEILDLHKEANKLEFNIETCEEEIASIEDEIESIENRIAEMDELEDKKEEINTELVDLRNRIDRIEQQAVEQFNDHMASILDRLEYANIERIWIENVQKEVRDGRQKSERSVFDLHVARVSENGTTYEDTVAHLSESEREVTGLVFALSGYLVHDLHEDVPFMLLDSLESIDSERIADLISYFEDFAEFLVVALLPEDAEALDPAYDRVTEI